MDDAVRNVGRELRALRRARGVSIAELARDTGFSEGYLNQVESGTTIPSISALADLAASLGTDLTGFFPTGEAARVTVARASDPHKLRVAPSAHEEYTVLSARGPAAAMTALVHRVFPFEEDVRYRHVGERFLLLLSGRLRLSVGSEELDLEPGDTAHYSSHPEHRIQVTSNGPAEILWLVTPAIL